jgi:uncharacterized membrane protein
VTEHADADRADIVPPPPDRADEPADLRPRRGRVMGIDLARGVALMGMMAVHVFATLHSDYSPSRTQQLVAGHALATFVLLAGVSLALAAQRSSSGSRTGAGPGWPDAGTAASMATRAMLIGLIGLVLNYTDPPAEVILPYYGAMFLLAIPLIRMSSRALVATALSLVAIAPLVVLASFAADLNTDEPTVGALAHPVELATTLLVSGSYPVVEYLAFVCAGIAIGRLDLSARRVAARLAAGGAALALVSWLVATLLMLQLGGLQHLRAAAPSRLGASQARNVVLWDPDPVLSWWWLAQRAPYTVTPLRMLHDLGVAMAVLGVCLLVTRVRRHGRLVRLVAVAGSMALTLYTAHILVLSLYPLEDHPVVLYAALVLGCLAFAGVWSRTEPRGPLEALVSTSCRLARDLVDARPPSRRRS